jgi:hypothetical protein
LYWSTSMAVGTFLTTQPISCLRAVSCQAFISCCIVLFSRKHVPVPISYDRITPIWITATDLKLLVCNLECPVRISTARPNILTDIFRYFFQSFEVNAGTVSYLRFGHNCFLPHPFQFILHQSLYNSTPLACVAKGWTVRGSNSGRGEFSAPIKTGPGAHQASYTMRTRSFPGVKRSGCGLNHPPTSSSEVKKE